MTNFIKDNTSLGAVKSTFLAKPWIPPDERVSADNWNEHRQSLLDIQSYLNSDTIAPLRLSASPDGSETGTRGQLAIDTTTGITWKNRAGTTRWDPVDIPPQWGERVRLDFRAPIEPRTTSIGGGAASELDSEAGHPGIERLAATAAGVDAAVMRSRATGMVLGDGWFVLRGLVRLVNTSNGTDNVIARFGAGDANTFADHTDGVYLENDRSTNGNNNWYLCAASGGTRTKTDTGIGVTASIWQHLEIRVNAAGTSVTAEIDGVAAATAVTTNIPTGAGRTFSVFHAMILKSLGSTARQFDVDCVDYWNVLSSARFL